MLLRWASSGFRPNKISGLVAWYRFGQGITVSTGVSQWDDASGNGRHLKQATATNQPAKQADGSILFDGVDNYLKTDAFTLNQPMTVYLRFKQVSWTDSDGVIDGNTALSMNINSLTLSPRLSMYAGTANDPATDSAVVGSYVSLCAVFNGASSALVVNTDAALTGSPGTSSAGGFTLGARATPSNYANIQVKEVVIFAAAHDSATRARMIAYLGAL